MRTSPRLAAGAVIALLLTGCANSDYGSKQTVGALAGAGAGGLLGAQIGDGRGQLAATAAGALIGAFLGNELGRSLDRADQVYASRAEYQALEYTPSGYEVPWQNPDSGHYGSITPLQTYQTPSGQYCRDYSHNASIDGYVERVHGTACRDASGAWRAVN